MSETSSLRSDLYTGLTEQLGPELADALMTFLPNTPETELATKSDIGRVEERIGRLEVEIKGIEGEIGGLTGEIGGLTGEIGGLEDDVRHLSHRLDDNFDRMSRRIDLQVQVTGAGFIALTTALIAAGFIG